MSEISKIANLGPRSAEMLAAAGIVDEDQLRGLGPVVAYLAVKRSGQRPSINLLWAIAAGLKNRHWTDLDDREKSELRGELERLTRSAGDAGAKAEPSSQETLL